MKSIRIHFAKHTGESTAFFVLINDRAGRIHGFFFVFFAFQCEFLIFLLKLLVFFHQLDELVFDSLVRFLRRFDLPIEGFLPLLDGHIVVFREGITYIVAFAVECTDVISYGFDLIRVESNEFFFTVIDTVITEIYKIFSCFDSGIVLPFDFYKALYATDSDAGFF